MDSGEKSFSKELDKAMDLETDYIADTHCSIYINTAIRFDDSFLESKNKGIYFYISADD